MLVQLFPLTSTAHIEHPRISISISPPASRCSPAFSFAISSSLYSNTCRYSRHWGTLWGGGEVVWEQVGEIKVGKAFNIFLPIICKHCQSIDIVELSIALPSKPVPDIGSKYLSPLQKSNCQVGDGREAHIAAITPYPSAPLLANLSCLCKSPCL